MNPGERAMRARLAAVGCGKLVVTLAACVSVGAQTGCGASEECDPAYVGSIWVDLPTPNTLASGGPLLAISELSNGVYVTTGGELRLLEIESAAALAVSPDGVGMAFDSTYVGPSATRFDAGSPPADPVMFAPFASSIMAAGHDGTAFVVAYLDDSGTTVAWLDSDAMVVGPTVSITGGGATAFAAGSTTFVLLQSGSSEQDPETCRWSVQRFRGQALLDPEPLVVATGSEACSPAAIASHGDTAVVVSFWRSYLIDADGAVGDAVDLGDVVDTIAPVAGGYVATHGDGPLGDNPTIPVLALDLAGERTATYEVDADKAWLAAAGDAARLVLRRDALDEASRTGTSQLSLADVSTAGIGPERILLDRDVELVTDCYEP